jgi:hypothetical protein
MQEQDHHDHEHSHPHPTRPDADEALSYYQVMEIAVRELLIEKGVVSADDVRRQIENMDGRTPARGAAVVARAWTDPAFKAKLLAEGNPALEDIGMDRGPYKLVVVENTPQVHNVVVCTLCAPRRHGRLDRGAARRDRDPRLHDRRGRPESVKPKAKFFNRQGRQGRKGEPGFVETDRGSFAALAVRKVWLFLQS